MKYVYVLVSNDKDLYYEQLYLSIVSLRLNNPNAYITLLTDDLTYSNLNNHREGILSLIQEYKVIEYPSKYAQKIRSRLLKTSMRNLIDGDFLYIDCDTLILSPINTPIDWTFSIGAVKNLHYSNVADSPIYPLLCFHLNKCGLDIKSKDYYNSGVLYVKDNEEARNFFSYWNSLYIRYFKEYRIDFDQLSLYQANNVYNGLIKELAGEWNWQVGFGINYCYDARIMHTFASVSNKLHNIHFLKRKDFYEKIKQGQCSELEIKSIVKNARKLFDETLRIVPADYSSVDIKQQIKKFCKQCDEIILYGIDSYQIRILWLLQHLNIKIDRIVSSKNELKKYIIERSTQKMIGKKYVGSNTGIILAMEIQQVNNILPSLIAQGLINIYVYN